MAAEPGRPSLAPEIGPDGIARENPVIAYTEKIIEAEQRQLKEYIKENYSKIRDVERELENLTLELKLTAGPKKAALELLRKKIEQSTERIRIAKLREDHARKVWEDAAKAVKDEEATKQKLCEDLSQLVQESSNTQFSRLEELKRRLEALNPTRASCDVTDGKQPQNSSLPSNATPENASNMVPQVSENVSDQCIVGDAAAVHTQKQTQSVEGDGRPKKKMTNLGRGKGNIMISKGRGSGWTGAGFDVDSRT